MSPAIDDEMAVGELSDQQTKPAPSDELLDDQQPVESDSSGDRDRRWARRVGLALLPTLALVLACTAGFLKWQDVTGRDARVAGAQAIKSANDTIVAMLSYTPANADRGLHAAADRLTGTFRDSYSSLINDVVIPGSTQKKISATARVAAAGTVSASSDRAVVLMFVDQTITIGADPPTDTASSVRVTLNNVDGRWLISEFTPV